MLGELLKLGYRVGTSTGRRMDRAVDPRPRDGLGGAGRRVQASRPWPGWSVLGLFRRCPGRRGHHGGQDSASLPTGELLYRTVCAHRQVRGHRPHQHQRSTFGAPYARGASIQEPSGADSIACVKVATNSPDGGAPGSATPLPHHGRAWSTTVLTGARQYILAPVTMPSAIAGCECARLDDAGRRDA
jgi:hypothetical protein